MTLNTKQRAFIEEYLICWNASEAARRVGYNGKSNVTGSRLLAYPHIKEAIQERLTNISSQVDEAVKQGSILQLSIKRNPPNKIYFIQAENGLVKIGIASDIPRRFAELNVASPIPLTILFIIDSTNAKSIENALHNVFNSKRVKGEWFNLSEADIVWVKSNYGIE